MPIRCANSVKKGVVDVVLGRPACTVKREFFHTEFSRSNDTESDQRRDRKLSPVRAVVARAGFAPAFKGYEPLVLSYATTAPRNSE